MAAPTLQNYEYQFKDAGVLLNQSTPTMPFWDVDKVSGLVDSPEIATDILDLDGRHGSFINSRYYKHRVIAISGTLYSAVSDVDTNIEALRTTLIPDGLDWPFYWKQPNISQRYHLGQVGGFNSDVDTGRRIGETPFLVTLLCGDPRALIDLSPISWTSNVNTSSFSNAGNAPGPLVVSITANATTTASLTIQNVTQGRSVVLTFPVTSGQAVTVDTDTWIVTVNGSVKPSTQVATPDYPFFAVGSQQWRVTSNIGNGNISAKSAWL